MDKLHIKLDNPVRVEELKPAATLKRLGLRDGMTVCDIGAGSGLFTIPAAHETSSDVYALDINIAMLAIVRERAESESLQNVRTVKIAGDLLNVGDKLADLILIATVLHEVPDKSIFLREVKRILKSGGKVAVIEFHPRSTPFGPPTELRLAKEDVCDYFKAIGLKLFDEFDLGENFYCQIFQ